MAPRRSPGAGPTPASPPVSAPRSPLLAASLPTSTSTSTSTSTHPSSSVAALAAAPAAAATAPSPISLSGPASDSPAASDPSTAVLAAVTATATAAAAAVASAASSSAATVAASAALIDTRDRPDEHVDAAAAAGDSASMLSADGGRDPARAASVALSRTHSRSHSLSHALSHVGSSYSSAHSHSHAHAHAHAHTHTHTHTHSHGHPHAHSHSHSHHSHSHSHSRSRSTSTSRSRSRSPSSSAGRRRGGMFQRESTRLRSNVADQVQRDLLPAGRMLSVFLIVCELVAECAVLMWSRGQQCDRPLRLWVQVLIVLQAGTVILNCLNIWQGRDSFGHHHRNGLSATEMDMYSGAVGSGADDPPSPPPGSDGSAVSGPDTTDSAVVVHISRSEPDVGDQSGGVGMGSDTEPEGGVGSAAETEAMMGERSGSGMRRRSALVSSEFVDKYVRIVNAWYLVWFILGSIWVSDGGTCATTAPHLYRLIVALTIIYYALLFLPLACFCLIVCCLPLFILVYRVMLPYAERERRRARAADPAHVESLTSIAFTPETFMSHTGATTLEDASCVICLCDYEPDDVVRFLPCKHHFHKDCVDVWLRLDKACCLCKQDIDATLV